MHILYPFNSQVLLRGSAFRQIRDRRNLNVFMSKEFLCQSGVFEGQWNILLPFKLLDQIVM